MSTTGVSVGVLTVRLVPNRRSAIVWFSLAIALGTSLTGCGETAYTTGMTYPVKGKVVLADGKPLTSGRISFVSEKTALTFSGVIGADGTFEVKHDAQIGAPEGGYRVRVEMDETSLPKAKRNSSALLPYAARYADEDASKLTATVKPGDGNTFEFKLEKK